MKINRNQVLLAIGLLAYAGPDLDAVARWLSGSGIPHITGVVHLLGWLATALGGLALAWPRIRSGLAALGLATPPGAQAPWIAGKDDVVPFAGAVPEKKQDQTPVTVPITPRKPDKGGALTGLLGYLALVLGICLTVVCVYIVMMFAVPKRANAQTVDPPATPQIGFKIGEYTTCQLATAAGWQFNLKSQSWKRFSFLQGFGCTYRGWQQPVGVAAYLGYAVAGDDPNAYQGALLFNFADVIAAGPGTQTFRDPVTHERFWQATINLVGNFSWGTSVSGLTKSLRMERLRMQAPVATPAPVVVQPVAIETKIIERPQPAKPAAVPATEAAPEIAPKSTGIRP